MQPTPKLRGTCSKTSKLIWHRERKNSIKEVIEKMCAEADVKVEELRGGIREVVSGVSGVGPGQLADFMDER